jgi:hypothetical protein
MAAKKVTKPMLPPAGKTGGRKKRTGTADSMERKSVADMKALKNAGAYYSGKVAVKPETTADTKAGRGRGRVTRTVNTLTSEGPRRPKAGPKPDGSEGPKRSGPMRTKKATWINANQVGVGSDLKGATLVKTPEGYAYMYPMSNKVVNKSVKIPKTGADRRADAAYKDKVLNAKTKKAEALKKSKANLLRKNY